MVSSVEETTSSDSDDFSTQLGERLIRDKLIQPQTLKHTLEVQSGENEDLGVLLVRLGLISERAMATALASIEQAPLIESSDYPAMPLYEEQLSVRFLKESRVIPLEESEDELTVAMASPQDRFVIDALKMVCGKRIARRTGLQSEIDAAIERIYGSNQSAMGQISGNIEVASGAEQEDIEQLKDMASEAPVVRLVNLIINQALELRASDIHIEPFEQQLRVRLRIDGVLREIESPPAHSTAAVISRVKLMGKLNIAERRLPQDGRIPMRIQGKEIDIRMSTVPTLHGESVVLRILDKQAVVLDFDALGFDKGILESFHNVLSQPHGIILVTGPTGSGKTTTLYTALQELNTPGRKLLTVEDPVEYQLSGVNQIQVKPQIGLTFANALRSIMRQDPDVIMIGEMRDLETAGIAVQSALTGHLVLSTLHTNDASSSVTRLLDMGVAEYLVTSTVMGILAQRLARKLCTHCRSPYQAMPEMVERLRQSGLSTDRESLVFYKATGCSQCNQTGYRGRIALLEFLCMSDAIRALILKRADATSIRNAARAEGMLPMETDGFRKAQQGITTVEEVLRVAQEVS